MVNDNKLSKDCGLGLAGFPENLPTRHRNWRFPLYDFLAIFICEARLPLSPHRNPQPIFQKNGLGVFLNIAYSSLASFAIQVSSFRLPWPLVTCTSQLSLRHHSRQATLHLALTTNKICFCAPNAGLLPSHK